MEPKSLLIAPELCGGEMAPGTDQMEVTQIISAERNIVWQLDYQAGRLLLLAITERAVNGMILIVQTN